MKLIDKFEAKFEREMERTKSLDRIYAAISTLLLGLVMGLFVGLPRPMFFELWWGGFDWAGFIIGFIGGCIFFPAIHKSIRAWRERRFWIG